MALARGGLSAGWFHRALVPPQPNQTTASAADCTDLRAAAPVEQLSHAASRFLLTRSRTDRRTILVVSARSLVRWTTPAGGTCHGRLRLARATAGIQSFWRVIDQSGRYDRLFTGRRFRESSDGSRRVDSAGPSQRTRIRDLRDRVVEHATTLARETGPRPASAG